MRYQSWIVLFVCVLGLAVFVRLWNLGKIPEGFYSDEALYGYEAFSLWKTGKDEFGNKLPLSIAGFGDYRPAYYIYTTIPFIVILGLTEFATRLPSALSSIATIIVTFFFILELTKNKKIALAGMLLLAISPWSVYFGRMAHETNLMTFFIILGAFFLWRTRTCAYCIVGSIASFVMAIYTYHSARIFVPLFLLTTLVLFRKNFKKNIFPVLLGSFLLTVLILPLIFELKLDGSWSRVQGISIWTDPGIIPKINELRGRVGAVVPPVFAKIIINKATIYSEIFIEKFISHFDPQFLLFSGDPNGVYNTPNTGILLWIEPVLLILGGWAFWKKQRPLFYWIFGAIIIGLIPDSLTRIAPSSARIHLILPFLALLNGSGIYELTKKRSFVKLLVVTLLTLNSSWFWYHYLIVRPVVHEEAWQIGVKEMVLKAQELSPQYEKIWISRSGWGWMHVLFHTKYDPATFQKEAQVSPRNDLGFWWVSDVGKYHLDWLPAEIKTTKKVLYIGTPVEFSPKVIPVDQIHDQFGHELYWFVDSARL